MIYDMLSWLVEPEHVAAVEADILDRPPDLTGGQLPARLVGLWADPGGGDPGGGICPG